MLSSGNIGTNEVTNKMSGNEKSSHVTRKKEGLAIWGVDKKPEDKPEIDFSELDKEFENG